MTQKSAFLPPPHRNFLQASSCRPLIDGGADDRDLRAAELMELEQHTRADRVRACGTFGNRRCGERLCPSCKKATASVNKDLALLAVARFPAPHFVTLTLPSRGPFRLGDAIGEFRARLVVWRRRAVIARVVRGGVGGVEPHLDRARVLWAVHAHLILDVVAQAIDWPVLGEEWARITSDRGLLLLPRGGSRVRSLVDAARYVTKPDDWCPDPGELPLRALEELAKGMRGKRVMVAWGTGRARP